MIALHNESGEKTMPVYPDIKHRQTCVKCQQEIRQGAHRYFSKQAGMKGLYHWACFIIACHEANTHGQALLEDALLANGVYYDPNTYDIISSPLPD